MLTQHIALVPEAGGVDLSELSRVSAALQKQVTRDLSPLWGMSATVDAFHDLEDVPVGYWPIVISRGELQRAAGVHLDRNGQPYAHIALSPLWSVEASRACLEMLISPFGDRTTTAAAPRTGQGLVELLVEICSPCAAADYGYSINGVLVSDFCTPAFFGASATSGGERYSFRGSIAAPFQLLRGGYLTWYEPSQNEWWMRVLPAGTPIDLRLGSLEQSSFGARDLVRRRGPARLWSGSASSGAMLVHTRKDRDLSLAASRNRAFRLRSLLGQRLEESLTFALTAGEETTEPALEGERAANTSVLLAADNPEHADVHATNVDDSAHEPVTTVYQLRDLDTEGEPLDVAPPREPLAAHHQRSPAREREAAHSASPTQSSLPPPLPTQRVSRPSEVARARRALPAENRSAALRAPRLPSSIAPVEVLSALTPAKQRRDGLTVASIGLAAAALMGLIWTQRGDTVPSTAARPSLPSAALASKPTEQPAAAQPAAAQTATAPSAAPSAQPAAMAPAPARPAQPNRKEQAGPDTREPLAATARPRRSREPAPEPVAERVVELSAQPGAQPVAELAPAGQHASALDKLIDTRR